MPTLVSSAFYFDSESVRLDSLAALGIDPSSLNSGDVLFITDNSITIDNEQHAGKILVVTLPALSTCTITVPADIVSGFSSNGFITVVRGGDGEVNFQAGVDAVVGCSGNLSLRNKFSVGYLNKVDADQWVLSGDISGTGDLDTIVDEVLALAPSITVPSDLVPDETATTNSNELYFSALGGTCSRASASNIIQISNNYGAPFEAEINGVNILPLNASGTFSISSINPGSTAQSFALFIGVSQFPFRTDKWIKAGIKIAYDRISSNWTVERIANGEEVGVGSASANPPATVTCAYNSLTSQLTTTAFNATNNVNILPYSLPLYSRIFITGDPSGISFSLTFSGKNNGNGKRVMTKIVQGESVVEVESYRIN